jgi:hypothetical protein
MKRWLFSLVVLIAFGAPLVAQDIIRLKVEMYRNASQIAAPTISIVENQTGSIKADEVTVSLSPSRLDPEHLSVNLEVAAGGKTLKPRLVLNGQETASMKWTDTDSFELRISALR